MAAPKSPQLVRNYFILPCCLLLLNLVNSIISYKAQLISDHLLRVGFVIVMILGGSGLVAWIVSPAIESLVRSVHRTSRRNGGVFGEVVFICVGAIAIFWLYYQVTIHGPASILPAEWVNPRS